MKKIIITCTFLISTLAAPSAPTVGALTIDEAVKMALATHPAILRARSDKISQKYRTEGAKAPFYPNLDFSYSFSREEEDIFFSSRESSTFSAEASLNLFRGFKDFHTYRQNLFLLRSEENREKSLVQDIILQVKEAFFTILKARENVAVADEAVRLLERQRRDTENMLKNGLVPKNELLKVEVELASAKQELLARQADLKISLKNLSSLTGITAPEPSSLEEPAIPVYRSVDIECLEESAVKRRSDIMYLKNLEKSISMEARALKGDYYPSADVTVTYKTFGDSAVPDGQGNSFLPDRQFTETLLVTWNIFSGGSTRKSMKSKLEEKKAISHEIENRIRRIGTDLYDAFHRYSVALASLKLAEKAVEEARENHRITNNQFRQGLVTATELLDARVLLTRAEKELISARYDIAISVLRLERIVEGEDALSVCSGGRETLTSR